MQIQTNEVQTNVFHQTEYQQSIKRQDIPNTQDFYESNNFEAVS